MKVWNEVNLDAEPIGSNILTLVVEGVAIGDRGEGASLVLVTECEHCHEVSSYNIEPEDIPERIRK